MNYRNPTLLRLAKDCPHCMCCGASNHGQVVGAHWRSLANGSGMGYKAPDLVAMVCNTCHDLIDQRSGGLHKVERELIYLRSFWKTVLWLFESEHLEVKK